MDFGERWQVSERYWTRSCSWSFYTFRKRFYFSFELCAAHLVYHHFPQRTPAAFWIISLSSCTSFINKKNAEFLYQTISLAQLYKLDSGLWQAWRVNGGLVLVVCLHGDSLFGVGSVPSWNLVSLLWFSLSLTDFHEKSYFLMEFWKLSTMWYNIHRSKNLILFTSLIQKDLEECFIFNCSKKLKKCWLRPREYFRFSRVYWFGL